MKKTSLSLVAVLILVMCGSSFVCASDSYPTKPIQVIVGWGAGGGTDMTAREMAPFAERELGKPWVVTNMPGAAGAIGAEQVLSKKADGYTLLFGSETISLWPLMGISQHWYKDFEPIAICSQGVATIAVNASSPWKTLEDFIDYAKANPKKIKMGITGPATTGAVSAAILQKCLGIEVSQVTYEGQGPAVVALLGGHIDVIMENLSGVVDHHKAEKLRILGVFDNKRVKTVQDIPAIGETYPETSAYLPYGAWIGLFAPKNAPQAVLDKLNTAMAKAVADPEWQDSVWEVYYIPVGLTGDEAVQFVDSWTSRTAWLIHDLGATSKSPADLGIPRPSN
jgi:tripartite-type tricarboxylate transporter receptor subunit TctC